MLKLPHTQILFKYFNLICILTLTILALYVAYYSPGFDDEFHNIHWFYQARIDGDLSSFWHKSNIDAIHPFGSYLISFIGMYVFDDWQIVRFVKTLIIVMISYAALNRIYPSLRFKNLNFVIFILITPSFLLFGTGLRWFGETLAIYTMMVALNKFIGLEKKHFFPTLLLLGYVAISLNYIGVILFPLIFTYHLYNAFKKNSSIHAIGIITSAFAIYLTLYFMQVVVAIDGSSQQGSFISSLIGIGHGIFVNWGIFPISILGIMSAIPLFFLTVFLFFFEYNKIKYDALFWLISCSILILVISGIGIKYRNIFPLLPIIYGYLLNLLVSSYTSYSILQRVIILSLLAPLAIVQIFGYWNVLNHSDTTKGSWNIPVYEVTRYFENQKENCISLKIFLWDPVLEYNLHRAGFDVNIFANSGDVSGHHENTECMFLVHTTSGSYKEHEYFKSSIKLGMPIKELGKDRYSKIKQWLGADSPEHYVKIFLIDEVKSEVITQYFTETKYNGYFN